MKVKFAVALFSLIFTLLLLELVLRQTTHPPILNRNYQRQDIEWTEKYVLLNSAGYRDQEYKKERQNNTPRVYVIGDSYTYGWLVDNPSDSYPEVIEKELATKLGQKVEVINAGSPGFSVQEAVNRFLTDGKFYSPDLVILGINDDEANFTKTFSRVVDPPLPNFLKQSYLYQFTFGNYFRDRAEKENHNYLTKIYDDPNSPEWKQFSDQILILQKEALKINASIAILIFPHIHPNKPNKSYDLFQYNNKFKEFGKAHNIYIIDPLEDFLAYPQKENLVINPLDPHPTAKMNRIAGENFLKQFNFDNYLQNHNTYTPSFEDTQIDKTNLFLGPYQSIRGLESDDGSKPWVYFETVNNTNIQDFPLENKSERQTHVYLDHLQTARSFTHGGIIGASILYYIYPKEKGQLILPKNIYGYQITGVNSIFVLMTNADGTVSSDYIKPSLISKTISGWLIQFPWQQNYHVFRLNLSVATKQLDIDPSGRVANITATQILENNLSTTTKEVNFLFDKKPSSFPQFFDGTEGYPYVFLEGVMSRVSAITPNTESINVIFNQEVDKDTTVELPFSAAYSLGENEIVKVTLERNSSKD